MTRAVAVLVLAGTLAACNKASPTSPTPTPSVGATLAIAAFTVAADLPAADGSIVYRLNFQVNETSGRGAALINTIVFTFANGQTIDFNPTTPVRVATGGVYTSPTHSARDTAGSTANASTVSLAVGFTQESGGAPGSISGSTTIARTQPPPTFTVAGVVNEPGGPAIPAMNVTVFSGTGSGRTTTTDGAGYYSIPGVAGTITLSFAKSGYVLTTRNVTINGDTRFDTSVSRTAPPFSRSGMGNTVFDMPRTVSRVRIFGVWNGTGTSNFIVRIDGRLIVNEILRDVINYDGTHLTSGGVVEITNSSAISWTFVQVQ